MVAQPAGPVVGLVRAGDDHRPLELFADQMALPRPGVWLEWGSPWSVADRDELLVPVLASHVGGVLMVDRLSRLSRSTADLSALWAVLGHRQWRLVTRAERLDTREAAGRLMLGVLARTGSWDRAVERADR
jgi:hypothetical protein